jgi:hypothetical protein
MSILLIIFIRSRAVKSGRNRGVPLGGTGAGQAALLGALSSHAIAE